jgi:hypothetical protein
MGGVPIVKDAAFLMQTFISRPIPLVQLAKIVRGKMPQPTRRNDLTRDAFAPHRGRGVMSCRFDDGKRLSGGR